jgi:hypothetical protein
MLRSAKKQNYAGRVSDNSKGVSEKVIKAKPTATKVKKVKPARVVATKTAIVKPAAKKIKPVAKKKVIKPVAKRAVIKKMVPSRVSKRSGVVKKPVLVFKKKVLSKKPIVKSTSKKAGFTVRKLSGGTSKKTTSRLQAKKSGGFVRRKLR